jgi:hypothetical protein
MSRLALTLASLALVLAFGFSGTAQAQNRPETEQCSVLRAMQWLDNGAPMDTNGRTMLDERERVACAAGLEAQSTEYWPNGVTFRSGSTWYYPNATTYSTGSAWYYPNGVTFTANNAWYYPNGVTLAANGQWYDAAGTMSSETGLLTTSLSRLPRARGDELLGARSRPGTADFWRMIYLVAMVWESRT